MYKSILKQEISIPPLVNHTIDTKGSYDNTTYHQVYPPFYIHVVLLNNKLDFLLLFVYFPPLLTAITLNPYEVRDFNEIIAIFTFLCRSCK